MKTLAAVLALAMLSTAPAVALERCTRAPLGPGPELGPLVCEQVTSDRGTTIAVRQPHEVRQSAPKSPESVPDEQPTAPPVGSMTRIDPTGFSRRGAEAGDPRRYCGDNQACQQWYVDNAYIAQNGEVRMKQPWLHDAVKRGDNTRYHPNIVLHPAR